MSAFTVYRYGIDAYGRDVLMTEYLHDWLEAYCAELGWRPQILQGAFMARIGGGAAASSGAHDAGGCLDLETEGRTVSQIDHMVNTARRRGAGAYRRDRTIRHGSMPPHMHLTLGTDRPLSSMAQTLWNSYLAGGDGLGAAAGRPANAPDYEWRPNPLVLTPPPEDWFDMATEDELRAVVREEIQSALAGADIPMDQADGTRKPENFASVLRRLVKRTGA